MYPHIVRVCVCVCVCEACVSVAAVRYYRRNFAPTFNFYVIQQLRAGLPFGCVLLPSF